MRATKLILSITLLFCAQSSSAQSADKDPVAIIELGGATSVAIKDATPSAGPTVALEVTPIDNWLELEAGVTPQFHRHSTQWSLDLLFKKPWTLSRKAEFMIGVGPEWVHTNEYGRTPNSVSGEAVLDFMFWPSHKRKFGWYFEPAYEYNFGRGHEQSLGVSAGLLIAIR